MKNRKGLKKEEVLILLLLAYVALGVVFYIYLLSPKMEENSALRSEVEQLDTELRENYATVKNYKNNYEKLVETRSGIQKKLEAFHTNEQQEGYLRILRSQMSRSLISFLKLSSEEYVDLNFNTSGLRCENPYLIYVQNAGESGVDTVENIQDNLQAAAAANKDIPKVEVMKMKLNAMGPYSSVKLLLDALNNSEKYVIVNEMTIAATESSSEFSSGRMFSIALNLQYPSLQDWNCMSTLEDAETLPEYTMPEEFLSGEYKGIFSLKDAGTLFK